MIPIVDLRECSPSGLFYDGRSGQKEGIVYQGEPWIAKYPRTTRGLRGRHLPPHTASPVSEYLGAHIYESLGIPAHQTLLGYRNGKVVCACKDFTFPNKRLFEFKEIKNALSDDDGGFLSAPSDGESIYLADVLAALETSPLLQKTPGVLERFWDMFVVDAFIKNPDRNNGNWGLLMNPDLTYELAPVYDLGSSLFSKRSSSLAQSRLTSDDTIDQDAFGTNVSCYRLLDDSGQSEAIHPFAYMARSQNPDLKDAVARFKAAVNMNAIDALIDEVPEEAFGHTILSERMKESHKTLLRYRLEAGFNAL